MKIVEPTKIKITKLVSFVVDSIACLSSVKFKRPRDQANTMAPTAPMAPPSVGVATPIKIVPSTKNINNKGGTITKTTREVIFDSKPVPNSLSAKAKANITKPHSKRLTTIFSSIGVLALAKNAASIA